MAEKPQVKFGFLDKSVDSPKAQFGTSKTATNIDIEKGNLEHKTLDMQNAISYKQSTTMFDENKTYSISSGDLVRSDDSAVGADILDYTLTTQISETTESDEENQLIDNSKILKEVGRDIIIDAYSLAGLGDAERSYIQIIPFIKIEYLSGGSVDNTVWYALTQNSEYYRTSNDFYDRKGQTLENFPTYEELDDMLGNDDYPYIDTGNVLINPIRSRGENWTRTDSDKFCKPETSWAGTLATYTSYGGGAGFDSFRVADIIVFGITAINSGIFTASPRIFRAGEVLYQYNADDDSALYLEENYEAPDIEFLNQQITDRADTLSQVYWVDWETILDEAAGNHGFYITVGSEEEGFVAGSIDYVFTNEQTIGSPYSYDIESVPSDIFDLKVYEYQLNTASKIRVNITDTVVYDSTEEQWSVSDSNAQNLKIYKRFPIQNQFYLLQEIDLQALVSGTNAYELKIYTDDTKDTEYAEASWTDGDTKYCDIIITDATIIEDIDTNEILTSDSNYPPDYDSDDGSDLGDISYVVNYQERIFYSIDGYLYFSQVAEPEYYPINEGAVFSFQTDITGLVVFDELLYIFTSSGIYILYGAENSNFQGWYLKPIDNDIEVLSDTAVKCDEYILFVAKDDGIYLLQGQQFKKISYATGDITDYSSGQSKFIDNRYYLFEYDRTTNADNDVFSSGIVFDTKYKGFYKNDYEYNGVTPAEVYKDTIWQSNDIDFNDREYPKRIKEIAIEYEGNIDVSITKDGTETTSYTGLSKTNRGWQRLNIDDRKFNFMNIKFNLNNSTSKIYDWKITRIRTNRFTERRS